MAGGDEEDALERFGADDLTLLALHAADDEVLGPRHDVAREALATARQDIPIDGVLRPLFLLQKLSPLVFVLDHPFSQRLAKLQTRLVFVALFF